MESVRVREVTKSIPRRAAQDETPRLWRNPTFWFYVRLALFVSVFLAALLLFPRIAS